MLGGYPSGYIWVMEEVVKDNKEEICLSIGWDQV